MAILISCETAGISLPEQLLGVGIETDSRAPNRHSGPSIDNDAGEIADRLASLLAVPCVQNPYRHDLIDVTRSLRHRQLYGPLTSDWNAEQRQRLIETAYQPYRERVQAAIETILQQYNFVIHLSVRTFALREGSKLRRTDIGLLYDPGRIDELNLCLDWIDELYDAYPNLLVRRNYPRRGTVDSLTKAMRGQFPAEQYLGIDVWMNRAWASRKVRLRDEAIEQFAGALRNNLGKV